MLPPVKGDPTGAQDWIQYTYRCILYMLLVLKVIRQMDRQTQASQLQQGPKPKNRRNPPPPTLSTFTCRPAEVKEAVDKDTYTISLMTK